VITRLPEPTSGRVCSPAVSVSQSYGEQHQVDRSDLLRVVGDIDVLQMKVAEGALDLEAIPANGIAMRATCNERHIMSGRSHPPAVIASYGARCHDRNPHPAPSARQGIRLVQD